MIRRSLRGVGNDGPAAADPVDDAPERCVACNTRILLGDHAVRLDGALLHAECALYRTFRRNVTARRPGD